MTYRTKTIKMSPKRPQGKIVKRAARLLKKGELVAFPTETVYGLGANAHSARAVKKIFKAKGRPSDNPLIVHIADAKDIDSVASEVPPKAKKLASKFWPGPLTLVLKKKKGISDAVTAGGKTVGVRVPRNEIARQLIRAAGTPVAAPSANASTKPSPTDAHHVEEDLHGKIPLILDGGRTRVGVESTVVDCTVTPPAILREGGVSRERIEKLIGKVSVHAKKKKGVLRSPGQKYKHYTPHARLILARGSGITLERRAAYAVRERSRRGDRVIVLAAKEHAAFYRHEGFSVRSFGSIERPETVARNIFRLLRECDARRTDTVVVESIPEKGIGAAVMDRMRRAASKIV